MSLSRKKVAEVIDYDPDECTSTGWKWELYDDGHVAAERHSRWSGSRTNIRYVSTPNECQMVDDQSPQEELESYVEDESERLLRIFSYSEECAIRWKKTNPGYVVP